MSTSLDAESDAFQVDFERIVDHIDVVVRGKRDVVRTALVCFFANGHLLIEDVPGVAKTSLAKAIAGTIGGTVNRIQFTPDLLPTDLLGVDVFNLATGESTFRHGPIFANVVLGDEINRASPKTQSALLEAMAEYQVTFGGTRYPVPEPFLCLATQNPSDHHGTFPLPEAQLDRFMMRISLGYPDAATEADIVAEFTPGGPSVRRPILSLSRASAMMAYVKQVTVTPALAGYIVDIVAATRGPEGARRGIRLGISTRGAIALAAAARALAASHGRSFAHPADVNAVGPAVLSHRLLLDPAAQRCPQDVIADIIRRTPNPGT